MDSRWLGPIAIILAASLLILSIVETKIDRTAKTFCHVMQDSTDSIVVNFCKE